MVRHSFLAYSPANFFIFTVVLQCNNFEVVNMGVMVPCHEILALAKAEGVDIVGLSGLIMPRA